MKFDTRLQPRFKPRRPWIGGDLQTMRNMVVRPKFDLTAWQPRRLSFTASNVTDRLSGYWHSHKQGSDKPLVILLHGLTGSADGVTIRASAHALLRAGFPVLRLNLRGAGDTAKHCTTQYHTGLTEDLSNVLDQLPDEAVRGGVFLFGYSLGANQILKFLGERKGFGLVKGAIAVCPPIDLKAAIDRLMQARNALYHHYLLASMKSGARACKLSAEILRAVGDARTIYEYDDKVTAVMHGFADAEDFYASNGAKRLLERIETPTLVIHAADDPWVPVRMMKSVPWSAFEPLIYMESPSGGHCGFHARGPEKRWHDDIAIRFLKFQLERIAWGQA